VQLPDLIILPYPNTSADLPKRRRLRSPTLSQAPLSTLRCKWSSLAKIIFLAKKTIFLINQYKTKYPSLYDPAIDNRVRTMIVPGSYRGGHFGPPGTALDCPCPISQCIPMEFPTMSSSSWNSKSYHGIPSEL
jgi:hypothetical protein